MGLELTHHYVIDIDYFISRFQQMSRRGMLDTSNGLKLKSNLECSLLKRADS